MIQKSYKINRRKISMIQNQKSSESVVPNHFKNKLDQPSYLLQGSSTWRDLLLQMTRKRGSTGRSSGVWPRKVALVGWAVRRNNQWNHRGHHPKGKGKSRPRATSLNSYFFICFWFLSHNFKFLSGDIGKVHK